METRRTFVAVLILAGACWELSGKLTGAQAPTTLPPQPKPEPELPGPPSASNPEKRALEENDKDIKKKVDKLYQLVSELKEQTEKTDSSKVFNLNLVRKAEEIEKLARDIKNRAKG
jgi:peptidoglycan hydrolase CwlO-like protein